MLIVTVTVIPTDKEFKGIVLIGMCKSESGSYKF
jgi:hypothetical protein